MSNILDMVGNTPLISLKKVTQSLNGVTVLAKAEYFNPSGSIKDRAAKAMLFDGIKQGKLTKDKIIIDATSGNTGIAYAMFGAAMGYRVTLCMPANASFERKKILRAYGAEIIDTDPLESSDGAYLTVKKLVVQSPQKYFYPDQYNNDINWKTHYETTGVEILEQTNHAVTHFVAGAGTSGSFMGISKRLKNYNHEIKTIFMQPDSPFHGLEGMKHMETTIKPGFFDESVIDRRIEIGTEEAYLMTCRLAREEGLFVGISSGANVLAAIKAAETLPESSVVVTLLCDSGYRYMSEPVFEMRS
ncbi:MAG: cysteine synthase family protein [Treponema sp.]|jgi:cysteine synthase B|nr:cysteine synthase family protein [Treponema sp.]